MKLYYGVVEDRNDPEKIGRVKARFFPIHTENKDLIPTESLPWASVLYPSNSNLLIDPPIEGTWVVGYFDDEDLQYPIVIGTVPGLIKNDVDSSVGFNDPAENLPNRPKTVSSRTLNIDGTGSTLVSATASPFPNRKGERDLNRFASNESINDTLVQHKIDTVIADIPTAGLDVGESGEITWAEPTTSYGAQYPYNYAIEFESGHLLEFDNTPDAERIHEFHRSGTFREIHPDGTLVRKIVNDNYDFTLKDEYKANYGNSTKFIQGEQSELFANTVTRQYNLDVTDTYDTNQLVNIGENRITRIGSGDAIFAESNFGVQSADIWLAGKVHLGADSVSDDGSGSASGEEPVVFGDKLVTFLDSLITYIDTHIHPTPTGPSGPPVVPSATSTVPPQAQLKQLLSEIVSTK